MPRNNASYLPIVGLIKGSIVLGPTLLFIVACNTVTVLLAVWRDVSLVQNCINQDGRATAWGCPSRLARSCR